MVPLHTDVLRTATEAMLEIYPDTPLVIAGYSRGSSPAAIVAGEMGDRIAGVSFIAPTWFSAERTPQDLARRGVGEAIEAIRRESPRDRFDLLRLGYHAAKEMVRRPRELQRDVASIATESRPSNLIERLESVARIGVVAGDHDGVCPPEDILAVAEELAKSNPKREVDIRTVETGHFHVFTNTRSRQEIIHQIYNLAA
jgi:pimeloyl-ACP methyl ester carboxylesterase